PSLAAACANPHLRSFPTRRSSDLARSRPDKWIPACAGMTTRGGVDENHRYSLRARPGDGAGDTGECAAARTQEPVIGDRVDDREDRKSTRLNSSHEWTSYAVFCLK